MGNSFSRKMGRKNAGQSKKKPRPQIGPQMAGCLYRYCRAKEMVRFGKIWGLQCYRCIARFKLNIWPVKLLASNRFWEGDGANCFLKGTGFKIPVEKRTSFNFPVFLRQPYKLGCHSPKITAPPQVKSPVQSYL